MLINEAAKNKWGTPRGYRIDVLKYAYPLIPDTDYNLQAARKFTLFPNCYSSCCTNSEIMLAVFGKVTLVSGRGSR